MAQLLETIVRSETCFTSFDELLNAVNYRPTIIVDSGTRQVLADEYDRQQEARGDARRAYRMARPTAWMKRRIAIEAKLVTRLLEAERVQAAVAASGQ